MISISIKQKLNLIASRESIEGSVQRKLPTGLELKVIEFTRRIKESF